MLKYQTDYDIALAITCFGKSIKACVRDYKVTKNYVERVRRDYLWYLKTIGLNHNKITDHSAILHLICRGRKDAIPGKKQRRPPKKGSVDLYIVDQ